MKSNSNCGGRQNPLVHMLKKTWEYSKDNRKNIVFYWILFVTTNAIQLLAEPLIWAKIINVITMQGITTSNIKLLFTLLVTTFFLEIVFWSMHGPARLMERTNAFIARASYRKHLLKGVMALPMEWHVDHHSGDTIDKVE